MITLAPPPIPNLPVFVIAHRRTLWGWHMEDSKMDGHRKAQVVAFQNRGDAEDVAHRLWIHRLKTHRWPRTVISSSQPLGLVSAEDVLHTSPNPLTVDFVFLDDLVTKLGATNAAVNLVKPMNPVADELDLSGTYHAAHTASGDQLKWLELMAKRARNKS